MARFGLCGPTYQSQSVNADCQRCVNLYPETLESDGGKSAMVLYSSPGLKVFATLTGSPVRGDFAFNGRLFAIGGTRFCEVLSNGTVIDFGAVTNDGLPVSFAANQANQLLIASAGTIYLFNLSTNTLSQPAGAPTSISLVGFTDGFFVALSKNSNQFQLSNSLDGTTWTGINVARISVFPENLVSMIVDHREIGLLGAKESVIYYDSGNTFPYDVVPGGFLEQGCAATFARDRIDNSVFWLGADERGQGIAWRNNGYTPQRISNHSVEYLWSRYPRISDAVSYAFQDQGHTFWHIYFPSGLNDTGLPLGASWRYDCATGMWHEVAFWDSTAARYTAHRSMCHAFAFGFHLVGDWLTGNIYRMDIGLFDDFGNPIRRMRRAPHISIEQQWMFHDELQLDLETGIGPQPPLTGPDMGPARAPSSIILKDANGVLWAASINDSGGTTTAVVASGTPQTVILKDSGMFPSTAWQVGITIAGNLTAISVPFLASYPQSYVLTSVPGNHLTALLVTVGGNFQANVPSLARDPQVALRRSRDGGHTWSNEDWKNVGQAGNYTQRVIWRRLGRARDMIYEISMTDPVPWRIIDAYLKATPGYQPTERLVGQLKKGA